MTSRAAQTVTLTNTGGAALNIAISSTTRNFNQTNNCGTSVAAGASCVISVSLTPTMGGPFARSGRTFRLRLACLGILVEFEYATSQSTVILGPDYGVLPDAWIKPLRDACGITVNEYVPQIPT